MNCDMLPKQLPSAWALRMGVANLLGISAAM